MRILVVADGKLSVLDCGRLARGPDRPTGGRTVVEAIGAMLGFAGTAAGDSDVDVPVEQESESRQHCTLRRP